MDKQLKIPNLDKKLKILRQEYHLTQEEVANVLGIHRSTYAFYEIGRNALPLIY